MTSLAMGLSFYGINYTPDHLLQYCDDNNLDRHSLDDIRKVAEHYGLEDKASYTYSFKDVKGHLATNNPVIIQGSFTPSGHVILVWGVDEAKEAWLCHDPAGDHTAPNGYRNPGWRSGGHVWYPSSWFDPAAAPDGKVWAHPLIKR